ncbi:MAG: NAD-dependent epimerase/dehydratase family protein, partial [Xanthomonadales bacterium]|nr:NAD-dependent epimerase/dehydratase family protein [Xanthomonadales bacterium]
VIDTSAYYPRVVRDSVGLLKEAVKQYLLVSTISVYRDFPAEDVDESSAVGRLEDPTTEDFRAPQNYGPLKALCEEAAEELMPGRVTNVRPGLIVGPGDWTDRFTYWPVRVEQGGEVLAPGRPEHTVQYIDVRDLAEWMVHTLEARVVGVYNAVGPKAPLRMGEYLAA